MLICNMLKCLPEGKVVYKNTFDLHSFLKHLQIKGPVGEIVCLCVGWEALLFSMGRKRLSYTLKDLLTIRK